VQEVKNKRGKLSTKLSITDRPTPHSPPLNSHNVTQPPFLLTTQHEDDEKEEEEEEEGGRRTSNESQKK